MGDDLECLGNKLLSNIDRVFKNDPDIDEYDMLPGLDSSTNRNPVRVVDHKLAIESWAVKILFCSASKDLRQWCLCKGKSRLAADAAYLCSLTRAVLLVRADHLTAWNVRKELVEARLLDVEEDLKLAKLILTKQPKSCETFAQRKWLLDWWSKADGRSAGEDTTSHPDTSSHYTSSSSKVTSSSVQSSPHVTRPCGTPPLLFSEHRHTEARHRLTRGELLVCEDAAQRYGSNYHAWTHRQHVLTQFSCCTAQVIEEELERTLRFVNCHVSDYSGFHYRQCLLSAAAAAHRSAAAAVTDLAAAAASAASVPGSVRVEETSCVTQPVCSTSEAAPAGLIATAAAAEGVAAAAAVTSHAAAESGASVSAAIVTAAGGGTSMPAAGDGASMPAAVVAAAGSGASVPAAVVAAAEGGASVPATVVAAVEGRASVSAAVVAAAEGGVSVPSALVADSTQAAVGAEPMRGFPLARDVMSAGTHSTPPSQAAADPLLLEELRLTEDLIRAYPGHEAVWNHRRFVIYSYVTSPPTHHTPSSHLSPPTHASPHISGDAASCTVLPHKKSRYSEDSTCSVGTDDHVKKFYDCEREMCERIVENCQRSGEGWQENLANRYLQWLDRFFSSLGQSSKLATGDGLPDDTR